MREQPADHGELFYASYPSYSLEALLLSLTSLLAFGRSRSRVSEAPRVPSGSRRSRGSCYGPRGSSRESTILAAPLGGRPGPPGVVTTL